MEHTLARFLVFRFVRSLQYHFQFLTRLPETATLFLELRISDKIGILSTRYRQHDINTRVRMRGQGTPHHHLGSYHPRKLAAVLLSFLYPRRPPRLSRP